MTTLAYQLLLDFFPSFQALDVHIVCLLNTNQVNLFSTFFRTAYIGRNKCNFLQFFIKSFSFSYLRLNNIHICTCRICLLHHCIWILKEAFSFPISFVFLLFCSYYWTNCIYQFLELLLFLYWIPTTLTDEICTDL